MEQHVNRAWRRQHGQSGVGDPLRQTDIDGQSERRGDLVLKELPEAPVPRIQAPQELAFGYAPFPTARAVSARALMPSSMPRSM
jgi:hypothetical protein